MEQDKLRVRRLGQEKLLVGGEAWTCTRALPSSLVSGGSLKVSLKVSLNDHAEADLGRNVYPCVKLLGSYPKMRV